MQDHVTVEGFIPFSGQWYWCDDGEECAYMVAVVVGGNNGKVKRAYRVLERA